MASTHQNLDVIKPTPYKEDRNIQYVTSLTVFPSILENQTILIWDTPFYDSTGGLSGFNIYRSFDSPFEGYKKINHNPVTVKEFNDNMSLTLVEEKPLNKMNITIGCDDFMVLTLSSNSYSNFYLSEETDLVIPVNEDRTFKNPSRNFYTSVFAEVLLDGRRIVPSYIEGNQIYINLSWILGSDSVYKKYRDAPVEDFLVRYYSAERDPYQHTMQDRVFYKVLPLNHKGEEITSLDNSTFAEYTLTQDMDWVWKAALHRNFWLIWFGGESCLVYLRKWSGEICSCQTKRNDKQVECAGCYGTGIKGGYVGPYEIKVLFESSNRNREFSPYGNRMTEERKGIMIPLPYLRNGDVVIKKDGTKLVLGDVENIVNRGIILQQEFNLSDTRASLKMDLPNSRNVKQFFEIPDKPGQINSKGKEPSFSHINIGLKGSPDI